jgi:hypothetical protein
MRRVASCLILGLCVVGLASLGLAQNPQGTAPSKAAIDAYVARLMAFDKNGDGKLTRDEITDERYLRVFDRADTKKTGVVTKEQLIELATRELAQAGGQDKGGFGPGDDKGPKGDKGPGGFGKGFFPDKGGFDKGKGGFGLPQPGQVMPEFVADMLKLTDEQKTKLSALQKDVDAKLDKILTDEQKTQWKEFRERAGRPFGQPPFGDKGDKK